VSGGRHRGQSSNRIVKLVASFLDQGINSATNFACIALVARDVSARTFAVFAIYQTAVLTLQWTLQAGTNDNILRSAPESALGLLRHTLRRDSRVLVPAAGAAGAAAVVALSCGDNAWWGVATAPFAVAALVSLDSVKSAAYALSKPLASLYSTVTFSLLQVGATIAAVRSDAPSALWTGWGLAACLGLLVGYRALIRSERVRTSTPNPFRVRYASETLLNSGSSQISSALSGTWLGLEFVGALRAAQTLYGPVAVLSAASRLVLVPQYRRRPSRLVWLASTSPLLAVTLVWSLAVGSLPERLGVQILGATWASAVELAPALAVFYLAQILFDSAFVFCRSNSLDRTCTRSRLLQAGGQLLALVLGAGVLGSATAFVLTSAASTLLAAVPCVHAIWGYGRSNPGHRPGEAGSVPERAPKSARSAAPASRSAATTAEGP